MMRLFKGTIDYVNYAVKQTMVVVRVHALGNVLLHRRPYFHVTNLFRHKMSLFFLAVDASHCMVLRT